MSFINQFAPSNLPGRMFSDLTMVTSSLWLFLNIGIDNADAMRDSPLNGRHIIITGNYVPLSFDTVRNSTGYIVYINGIAGMMLPFLSAYYNFTFAPLQVKENVPLDPSINSPGLLTFMLNGSCDVVTTIAATTARAALADFSHPVLYPPVSYLIPKPVSSVNVLSVAKPFKFWAWMGILAIISIVAVSISFSSTKSQRKQSTEAPVKYNLAVLHVFGILVLQSVGWISNRRLSTRIVIGSWSIAAFILGLMYNTELTSFITAPNPQPLINTIYDLRDRYPNLRLVTEKDRNVDALLSAADNGFYKLLGDKLRSDPKSRCITSQKCVDMVKEGNTIYTSSREAYLYRAMRDDFLATGKCNIELSKEVYLQNRVHWATRKNSPYIDAFNLGFIKMRQSGFIDKWYDQFTPDIHQCLENKKQPETVAPFSLKHLTGAFTVLLIGYFISFVVFIYERIAFSCKTK